MPRVRSRAGAGPRVAGTVGTAAAAAGGTAAALVAVGAAAVGAAPLLRSFASFLQHSNRELAAYNGSLAVANAQLVVGRVLRNIDRGAATAESGTRLTAAVNRMEERFKTFDTLVTNSKNALGQVAAGFAGKFAEIMQPTFTLLNKLVTVLSETGVFEALGEGIAALLIPLRAQRDHPHALRVVDQDEARRPGPQGQARRPAPLGVLRPAELRPDRTAATNLIHLHESTRRMADPIPVPAPVAGPVQYNGVDFGHDVMIDSLSDGARSTPRTRPSTSTPSST